MVKLFVEGGGEANSLKTEKDQDPSRWQPWHHLKARDYDGWSKPDKAQDRDGHLIRRALFQCAGCA